MPDSTSKFFNHAGESEKSSQQPFPVLLSQPRSDSRCSYYNRTPPVFEITCLVLEARNELERGYAAGECFRNGGGVGGKLVAER